MLQLGDQSQNGQKLYGTAETAIRLQAWKVYSHFK